MKINDAARKYERERSAESALDYIKALKRSGQPLYLEEFLKHISDRNIEKIIWKTNPSGIILFSPQIGSDIFNFTLQNAIDLFHCYEIGPRLLGVAYKKLRSNYKIYYYVEYDDELLYEHGFRPSVHDEAVIHEYVIIELTINPNRDFSLTDFGLTLKDNITGFAKKSSELKHCNFLENLQSQFARQIYEDKKEENSAVLWLSPHLRKYEWFIMRMNGKIISPDKLPKRPYNTIPTEGDPYYPWDINGLCPHWHANQHTKKVESLHFFGTKTAARHLVKNKSKPEFPVRYV